VERGKAGSDSGAVQARSGSAFTMRGAGCGKIVVKGAEWIAAGPGASARLSCLYAAGRDLDLLEKDDCLNDEQSPSSHRPWWRSGPRCGAIRQRRVGKVLGAYPGLTFLV
jgi:hypothetical protein